jgi:exosortase
MSENETAAAPREQSPVVNESEFSFAACWQRLPDKGLFFFLLAAWLAVFHFLGNSTFGYVPTPSLFHWMYNAYNSKSPTADDGHANLIPFVVLALFWFKRKQLLTQPLRTWWPGLVILAFALVLHIVGYVTQQTRICIVGLFMGIYGLMGLTWGTCWLRASFFPYFLFLFMVPLGSLTEPVTFPLRLMVTKLTGIICNDVLGMNVVREGTRLFSGSLDPGARFEYEVAAACSGIRSLVAITAIAVVYAFLVFRTWGARAVMILSAVPLAVAGNVFRMLTIILTAEFWGQKWGNYVHEGGPGGVLSLLPYVPATVGLMLMGYWLEKREKRWVEVREAKAV